MKNRLNKSLGTWEVMVAGVALVVASSTLVSDFTGFFTLGGAFAIALCAAFLINMLLGISVSDLAVSYPKAGALYNYAKEIFKGKFGVYLGVFLGISFWGMSAFAVSGETTSGAFALQGLLNIDLDISFYIIILTVLAVIPNIFGIKTMAWVNAGLLLLMLGIRWFFGIAGFFSGTWSVENLAVGSGALDLFGDSGILTIGLSLAFWSFVGIEFFCSLAEEVKNPKKSLPKGIILGLIAILFTSLIMGLGVAGSNSNEFWQGLVNSELGNNGESPHLAVGFTMFGGFGYLLMSIASVSATLGSLTVMYAAMPRIIYSIARDGKLFSTGVSTAFGKLHKKFNTPVISTIFTMFVFVIPALYSSEVITWVFSAAYVWFAVYIGIHILSFINRIINRNVKNIFNNTWLNLVSVLGVIVTVASLYVAFQGSHFEFGTRAVIVLLSAFCITIASFKFAASKKNKTIKNDKYLTEEDLVEELIK